MTYHKKEALQANLEAIRTLLALENTRRAPSESDRATLRRYNGFGGLKCVLLPAADPADIDRWPRAEHELFPLVRELRKIIDQGASGSDSTRLWNSIKSSVLTSFYTDERIVGAIAAGLGMSGLPLRRMLDPSAGMGVFSQALAGEQTDVVSFEKDLVTGRILRLLTADNPRQTVRVEGFEEIEAREAGRFDLVASNIPFGNFVIYDRAYSKGKDAAKREATRAICPTGEKATIKVCDGRAIQMADTKIEEIRQAFVSWLGRTPDTFKQQLVDRYNRLFNCFVRPDFDGSHQTFPGLDLKGLSFPDLYPSQKDAVWMLKTNGGGICDHEVGGHCFISSNALRFTKNGLLR